MVSEKDKQVVESSQGDPGTDEKKGITRVNEEKTEGKKEKKMAFPLGGHSTVSLGKDATGTSSGDKDAPLGNEGAKQDITNSLEEGKKPPPEKREDIMALDEESKKFIGEEVKSQTDPVKQKLDEVKTGMDTLREVVEKINTTTPPTPQVKMPTKQELIEGTKEALKKEETERRDRLERDQKTKDREEKLNKVYNYCFNNPEAAECKTLPDYLKKQLEEALKKTPPGKKPEEKKVDDTVGFVPLESMTEEKRKIQTEEENKVRDSLVDERLKSQNITSNDIFRQFDEKDLENIRNKKTMRDPIIEALTPDELAKAVEIRCTDDACQVKLREGGFAIVQKDKNDGKWKAVDKEVAKDMKPLF